MSMGSLPRCPQMDAEVQTTIQVSPLGGRNHPWKPSPLPTRVCISRKLERDQNWEVNLGARMFPLLHQMPALLPRDFKPSQDDLKH